MILFAFLICHTLIVMLMYMLKVAGKLKVDDKMFVMIVCIPFWGAISSLFSIDETTGEVEEWSFFDDRLYEDTKPEAINGTWI